MSGIVRIRLNRETSLMDQTISGSEGRDIGERQAHSSIEEILERFRARGVRVWIQDSQLRYRAPKNTLTDQDLALLREVRDRLLDEAEGAAPEAILERRSGTYTRLDSAPLSFSQVQHWHLYRLYERPGFRHLASLKRLSGQLDIEALRKCVSLIIQRHDALRTRIFADNGVLTQKVVPVDDFELQIEDLTGVADEHRDREVYRRLEELILQPIDVSVGPLFGMKLLRMQDREHVLIVVMEHIVSDEWSLNVFLRDVFTAYSKISGGLPVSLPKLPIQFVDYASWQLNRHEEWLRKHAAYWDDRLAGCQRLRFPADENAALDPRPGWSVAPVSIDRNLRAELNEWCRQRRTTVVMSICTAYVAMVMRWCHVTDTVIRFETNGRSLKEFENTIGYFTSPLFLRVELHTEDRFIDLLHRTTEEYCMAFGHADSSYIESQLPRPEFARNTAFNWVPQQSEIVPPGGGALEAEIVCSSIPFLNPRLKELERDTEPFVVFFENDKGINGGVWFPMNRFSRSTMNRFGGNLLVFIRALLARPEMRIVDIALMG